MCAEARQPERTNMLIQQTHTHSLALCPGTLNPAGRQRKTTQSPLPLSYAYIHTCTLRMYCLLHRGSNTRLLNLNTVRFSISSLPVCVHLRCGGEGGRGRQPYEAHIPSSNSRRSAHQAAENQTAQLQGAPEPENPARINIHQHHQQSHPVFPHFPPNLACLLGAPRTDQRGTQTNKQPVTHCSLLCCCCCCFRLLLSLLSLTHSLTQVVVNAVDLVLCQVLGQALT